MKDNYMLSNAAYDTTMEGGYEQFQDLVVVALILGSPAVPSTRLRAQRDTTAQ